MEIISANDGLLTDLDAYLLLKERVKKRGKGKKQPGDARAQKSLTRHRDWVERETIRYLQELPAGSETAKGVKSFLAALKEFMGSRDGGAAAGGGLTLAETLQLVNIRPVAPVEVHLVIEECAERLSDEDVEALCELVVTHLGGGEGEGGAPSAEAVDMEVAAASSEDVGAS